LAKGQKRSNRETKKPKQEKVPLKPSDPFASKMTGNAATSATAASRGKTKG
jgi:hypothetical protein